MVILIEQKQERHKDLFFTLELRFLIDVMLTLSTILDAMKPTVEREKSVFWLAVVVGGCWALRDEIGCTAS